MTHVHTMIKDPSSIRKEVLGSSLESVEFLRSMQTLEHVHQQKQFYLQKIATSLKNLKLIQGKIAEGLPNIPTEFGPIKKKQPMEDKPKAPKEVKRREVNYANPLSEKQKIDQEIRELHRRISELDI